MGQESNMHESCMLEPAFTVSEITNYNKFTVLQKLFCGIGPDELAFTSHTSMILEPP